MTVVVTVLAALGFFGLDEVAEILENPFGNDPNSIELKKYGKALMHDLELMYNGKDTNLDTVFTDDCDLQFHKILYHKPESSSIFSRDESHRIAPHARTCPDAPGSPSPPLIYPPAHVRLDDWKCSR
eukprot:gnl/TRDRNA2_/TRDRNA2_4777_c0_seq1.p1 gnl/TRDRNA2_/TRDRNA2_4777_c0~~gnl/TRDRNA2_/TRDRNA2_4777_c0_seq1.p1  ORF type:complete len:146 (-),score=15.06 gnl/TRDRNA2_/TRDRNA2_4777_c0_seq1:17-397(-)